MGGQVAGKWPCTARSSVVRARGRSMMLQGWGNMQSQEGSPGLSGSHTEGFGAQQVKALATKPVQQG